jgi:hypothetical protein
MATTCAAAALSACVTINVYFPAAEAKEAAKDFVEKVIGDDAIPCRHHACENARRRHGEPPAPQSTRSAWSASAAPTRRSSPTST